MVWLSCRWWLIEEGGGVVCGVEAFVGVCCEREEFVVVKWSCGVVCSVGWSGREV